MKCTSVCGKVDPLSYFSFQPVLHDWCNKDRGMCYPLCEVAEDEPDFEIRMEERERLYTDMESGEILLDTFIKSDCQRIVNTLASKSVNYQTVPKQANSG